MTLKKLYPNTVPIKLTAGPCYYSKGINKVDINFLDLGLGLKFYKIFDC